MPSSAPSSQSFHSMLLLLLLVVVAALLVVVPSVSAQAGCYPCVVSSCAVFFNGSAPNVSIGAAAPALAAAECNTLNTDIGGFVTTAQNASCAVTVAALACQVIGTVNATEVNCNTSTIGIGTPFANTTYFQQRCASTTACLGYLFQDEVYAAGACNSFQSFVATVIATPQPSTVPCAPCNISSCYGLSTIGVTDVTFWAGSLPGLAGSACAAQQATAVSLLSNGAAGVPLSSVQQAVCNPLAALAQADTQAACNAGQVDAIFDGIIFSSSATLNITWQQDCVPLVNQLFTPIVAQRLIQAGYCLSPSGGLTSYALQYLLNQTNSNASSSTGRANSISSSTGSPTAMVVVSTGAGNQPSVNAAAPSAELRVPAVLLLTTLLALLCLAL